jgi:hypothetical protein
VELLGSIEIIERDMLVCEPPVEKRDEGNNHQDHDQGSETRREAAFLYSRG